MRSAGHTSDADRAKEISVERSVSFYFGYLNFIAVPGEADVSTHAGDASVPFRYFRARVRTYIMYFDVSAISSGGYRTRDLGDLDVTVRRICPKRNLFGEGNFQVYADSAFGIFL